MNGRCRAKNCNNLVRGTIKDCPSDVGPVYIQMFCRDTRFVKYDDVKRPLNGTERSEVQEELTKISASAWRKKKAKETIDPGDTGSPFVYDPNTLHQAKKEVCDKELGINSQDTRDMILAVCKMNIDPTYVHSILAIGDTPFFVFYATPTQFQAYDEYQRTHRKYSSVSVDASSGMVKRLVDSSGDKTGYIFLYEIVINFNGTSVAIYQMLSEIHDVNFINFWLRSWLQERKAPSQAVSDGSKALFNAISLAFNYKPLKEYINYCFEIITTDSDKRPNTFMRLDTAHLIHSVSKWKCFQSAFNKIVETFFIHCIALIIECKTLKKLEEIFILIMIAADTEFEDSVIAIDNKRLTPGVARHHLENLISDRKSNSEILIPDVNKDELEKKEKGTNFLDQLSKLDVNDRGWSVELLKWVNTLDEKARTIIYTWSELNSFRVEGLREQLVAKIKEFPIFTNICTPDTMSRATSCYVEGDFKDLKMNLKKRVKLPTTLIKFLKLHIEELSGGICIFRSKVNKFIVDNQYGDELNDDDHVKWFENWIRLGKNGAAQNMWINNSNAEKENVSDNSNLTKEEVQKDKNSTKKDAHNSKNSSKEELQNEDGDIIFAAENVCSNSNIDVSTIIYDHDYSLLSDSPIHSFPATESSENYLKKVLKKSMKLNQITKKILNIFIKKGFSALEEALEFHVVIYNVPCQFCKVGKQTRQNVLKQYLYIELDIRGCNTEKSGRKCRLRNFPVRIRLNNENDDGISINLCFRLSGIAAYNTGHYLAYCRKLSGTWTKFNDLSSKPEFVSPGSELKPHRAFYILEEEVII